MHFQESHQNYGKVWLRQQADPNLQLLLLFGEKIGNTTSAKHAQSVPPHLDLSYSKSHLVSSYTEVFRTPNKAESRCT